MVAAQLSESRWHDECASVRLWLGTKPSTVSAEIADRMLQRINAPLPNDASPIVVIYCYADVPAGTEYEVAFDPNDPGKMESTHAEVLFGVVMGRAVELTLSHGWHQTAVLRFLNGLPELFSSLPIDDVSSQHLGLCSRADYPEIKRSLTTNA